MAGNYTTPGVYIVEKNAFPNSVVQVETALPAFIGFTQKASYNGKDLTGIPTRIDSLKQFEDYFGTGYVQRFTLTAPAATPAAGSPPAPDASPAQPAAATPNMLVQASTLNLASAPLRPYQLAPVNNASLYYLYNSIRLFYLNGGSTCYIISLGFYDTDDTKGANGQTFIDAIGTLVYEQDPTMLLCPDALRLVTDDGKGGLELGEYNKVMTAMLAHCAQVQSRVALFDVGNGAVTRVGDIDNTINAFREGVGQNFLNYGVAYFPWVKSSVIADTDLSFYNLDQPALEALRSLLNPTAKDLGDATRPAGQEELKVPALALPANPADAQNIFDQAILLLDDSKVPQPTGADRPADYNHAQVIVDKRRSIDNSLRTLYGDYKLIIKAMTDYLNTLPVSPAMAGVYTAVDSSRGVWKAPANWSLNAVVGPTVSLSDREQGRLNVDALTGKSINVIRAFKGMGTLVWGARTLDGNSQDWRYINVRRTMIMIEQSVKLAAHAYVFEPNDANTWVTVKSAINNFLFNLWKQGALAGAVPDDAYQTLIGLGSTMTADDILNGYMNVTVLVAIVRPAEFIELTFQQQMQKS